MKIGIVPVNVGVSSAAQMVSVARKAEEVGLESVWTFEHVVVPESYASRYPYHSKGKMAVGPETPFVDPFVALSHLAAATTTLRLGTGVNILPQANPLLAAKQVASLDFVSGGRFLFGVGTGWLREEYEALGVPFERRGARFDEYLTAMKKVWGADLVEHEGEFIRWSGFKSYPQPVQRPHPPILIGGTSEAAFRRVARHGDGWIAPNKDVAELRAMLSQLGRVAEELGRDPSTLETTAMWVFVKEAERLRELEDMGVARVLVPLSALPDPDPLVGLEKLAEATLRG